MAKLAGRGGGRAAPRLVIVSNRVPVLRGKQLAGGLAVALKDAIAARETLWFGWSGKETKAADADRVAAAHPGPRRAGGVRFATIDLTHEQYLGFYVGHANSMLWPLFHGRVGQPVFRRQDMRIYDEVNELYARALAPLLKPDDTIWVQDYQLIPCGQALRQAGARNRIGFFLHIPFPPPFLFDTLPQGEALLRSFAGYDVIGLQTQDDADNLNQCFARAGLKLRAECFPIGIDSKSFADAADRAEGSEEQTRLEESLGGRALILGVDRLDYTKGLPERFRGFAQLLSRYPEHRTRVTFLQVAPVSRGDVAQYRTLKRELDGLAGRINGEFAEFDYVPLRYLNTAIARDTLAGFHRRAAVGLVTPLRDGMNLVAKEFVAAQDARSPGALVLSRFAGAASAMQGALLVNPYDPDEIADALNAALKLDVAERRARWVTMNEAVQKSTAAIWANSFLQRLEG
jgi:trehalose 6-phosphate synthase